jgi:hypothetical protein
VNRFSVLLIGSVVLVLAAVIAISIVMTVGGS